jgi:hypothetical protein
MKKTKMTESDIFYTLEQVNKHLSYRDYDVIINDISNKIGQKQSYVRMVIQGALYNSGVNTGKVGLSGGDRAISKSATESFIKLYGNKLFYKL